MRLAAGTTLDQNLEASGLLLLLAAVGGLLLVVNPLSVWFARYPNSEMPMQALLFAGMLAFARAHVDGDLFFAPIAGTLLGLLLFLRFDAVLVIAALGATMVLLLGGFLVKNPTAVVMEASLAAEGAAATMARASVIHQMSGAHAASRLPVA